LATRVISRISDSLKTDVRREVFGMVAVAEINSETGKPSETFCHSDRSKESTRGCAMTFEAGDSSLRSG
jgi:hypothetical protein